MLYKRDTLKISRWTGRGWTLQATVALPGGGPWGPLRSASLTHSGAPDFIVSVGGGADWTPLTVVSRLHGVWQTVPFDVPAHWDLGRRLIDGWAIHGDKVQGKMNGCGCAAGPETYTWYGFDGRIFAPTSPPGQSPGCTTRSLALAHRLQGDPTYLGLPRWRSARSFPVARFACLDGWALAASRSGLFALFDQQSGAWLRAYVGSLAHLERDAQFFAIPGSLLKRLKKTLSRP